MSRRGRWEYLKKIHGRYREAGREGRSRILDEFCEVAGYHRKYALRLLNGPAPGKEPKRRRCRWPHYSSRAVAALEAIWRAAGYPWSVRLKALLPVWMPWAKRRLQLGAAVERQVLAMTPRQMDRRLAARKRRLKKRLYGRTKPGSLLKHHIPLRTDVWDVSVPGFSEVDLVAHSGDCGDGVFSVLGEQVAR